MFICRRRIHGYSINFVFFQALRQTLRQVFNKGRSYTRISNSGNTHLPSFDLRWKFVLRDQRGGNGAKTEAAQNSEAGKAHKPTSVEELSIAAVWRSRTLAGEKSPWQSSGRFQANKQRKLVQTPDCHS